MVESLNVPEIVLGKAGKKSYFTRALWPLGAGPCMCAPVGTPVRPDHVSVNESTLVFLLYDTSAVPVPSTLCGGSS